MPIAISSGGHKAQDSNQLLLSVLTDILKESKKTNLHNALMTDTVIDNTDVEV